MDDPEVETWAQVGATLKKKIFDTTDNPVIPLARYIDADPEDLKSIAVQYPDTALTEDQTRQLDLILELERQKEGLKVEMNFVGADSLQTLVAASGKSDVSGVTPETFETPIQGQVSPDSLNLDTAAKQTSFSPEVDSLAVEYMNTMINRVSAYLKKQQPDTRIAVQKARVSNKDNIDAPPQFKMQYTLRDEDEEAPNDSASENTSEQ